MLRLFKSDLIKALFFAIGILAANALPARAQESPPGSGASGDGITYGEARKSGYWLAGFRGGISIIPAHIDGGGGTKGGVGPHFNLSFARVVDDIVALGLMTEYESHSYKVPSVGNIGKQEVYSIIPYAEFRGRLPKSPVILTGSLGIGANLNFFDENASGFTVKPEHKVAVRLGVGAEAEVQKDFTLGMEIAYKSNNGTAEVSGSKVANRLNSLAFLFGGKIAF